MSAWQKQKNWWNEVLWKPKKGLSLDQLKFQHQVLLRNPAVTNYNRQLLVETFRCIAEVLIWGDQNDARVFDFFLEKNMQAFFLKTLSQKCGPYVSIQLLQTLNILFENIRNETSLYYLLSNNHINSIIVLKLDFSDEEILAYYISFLKTLSFHLNKHTIHFFYNEHLRDFPLYTEAIKFFKHSESMVRIAVRTLTLNVYRVQNTAALQYICSKTAVPYFSDLVWFIGTRVIELEECLISQKHHLSHCHLEQLVAEHLDHFHYISDIFSLEIQCLNDILSDSFLNRLLIPLYVYSLTEHDVGDTEEKRPRISRTLSLFLLSQVFLILSHSSIITPLTYLLFTGDTSLNLPSILLNDHQRGSSYNSVCAFVQPESSLETTLIRQSSQAHANPISMATRGGSMFTTTGPHNASSMDSRRSSLASSSSVKGYVDTVVDQYVVIEASPSGSISSTKSSMQEVLQSSPRSLAFFPSSPDSHPCSPGGSGDRHLMAPPPAKAKPLHSMPGLHPTLHGIPVVNSLFLDSIMGALVIINDDTRCLFALSMLYAMLTNKGVHHILLEDFSMRPKSQPRPSWEKGSSRYNIELMTLLLTIIDACTSTSNCIRLVTLHLAIMLLQKLLDGGQGKEGALSVALERNPMLEDQHIALIESIYESAILKLRLYYKGPNDELFLELFEEEFEKEKSFKLNILYLMMDESMLLPPTDTPLTGIDFTRRLPCGEHERARKAMRVFFATRQLSQQMSETEELVLPLTSPSNSCEVGGTLDTSPHDLAVCKVSVGETVSERFMVVTEAEFILVDPHKTRVGCGVVHFIAFLQDMDVSGDPADAKALFIVVYNRKSIHKYPSLSGRFVFEDHIRCSAAKTFLQRSRDRMHLKKMTRIAKLLHLPLPDSLLSVPCSQNVYHQLDLSDGTPTSITSVTPTLTTPISPLVLHPTLLPPINADTSYITSSTTSTVSPSPSHPFTSSGVHSMFSPASMLGKMDDATSQTIEMSSLNMPDCTTSLFSSDQNLAPPLPLGVVLPTLDKTPVRLSLPVPSDMFHSSSGYDTGNRIPGGNDSLHDFDSTLASPNIHPRSDVGEDNEEEERLTVSGGLLQLRESSSERLDINLERCGGVGKITGLMEELKEQEVVCPLGVELGLEKSKLKLISELYGENSPKEFSNHEYAQGSQSTREQMVQSHLSTEYAYNSTSTEHAQNNSTPTGHAQNFTCMVSVQNHEQIFPPADNAQKCDLTDHAWNRASSENFQNSAFTDHAKKFVSSEFAVSAEHAQNSPSTEHAQDCTFTERAQDCTSTEHAQDCTSTEHAHCASTEHAHCASTEHAHCTSTEHAQDCTSTEHAQDCTSTEHAQDCTSTERAQDCTSTEHAQDCTSTEHAQDCTSTEHAQDCTSTERSQDCTSTEHAQDCTSTEHAHCASTEHAHCASTEHAHCTSTEHAQDCTSTEHAQDCTSTEHAHCASTEHAHCTSTEHAQDCTSTEHAQDCASTEHAQDCTSTEHAQDCTSTEHAQDCTSTERAQDCTSTERSQDCTSTEHAHCTSTEHAQDCTSTEHAQDCASTEHAQDCTSTERSQDCTSTEHAQDCTSTERSQDCTSTEHAQDCTSTEHAQDCTSTERSQDCTSTEHAQDCTSTEHAHCTSTEHAQDCALSGNFASPEYAKNSIATEIINFFASAEHTMNSGSTEHVQNSASIEHVQNFSFADYAQNPVSTVYAQNSGSIEYVQDCASTENVKNSASAEHARNSTSTEPSGTCKPELESEKNCSNRLMDLCGAHDTFADDFSHLSCSSGNTNGTNGDCHVQNSDSGDTEDLDSLAGSGV